MTLIRITSAFKFMGIALCLAFALQLILTDAEHSGFFECEVLHAANDSSGENTKDLPADSCHVVCGHLHFLASADWHSVTFPSRIRVAFSLRDEFAPDGPVQAIDYPPQLS
jgi:hypothetical protein